MSVSIGKYTYGQENLQIVNVWENCGSLTIGSFCSLARVTIVLGGEHRVDWITTYPFGHTSKSPVSYKPKGHPTSKGNVSIGNDVWIANDVTILSGVSIGDGAVIGKNSLVAIDVEPYTVVGGNPIKLIKHRFDLEIIDLLLELRWWELDVKVIEKIAPILCDKPSKEIILDLVKKYKI